MTGDIRLLANQSSALPVPPAGLASAAREYETPLYVTDVPTLMDNISEVEEAFPAPWIRSYSLKANGLPQIVARIAARGWGANVVSPGEALMAQRAGVPNDRITVEGIGKTDKHIASIVAAAATGNPYLWTAIESADEAKVVVEMATAARLGGSASDRLDVLLRVNPDVQPETLGGLAVGRSDSKFGMSAAEITSLVDSGILDSRIVNLRGLHVHVGSQLGGVEAWLGGVRCASELLTTLNSASEWMLDTLDLGGGFPAAMASPHVRDFADELRSLTDSGKVVLPARVAIEPGRAVVATAGWIVASVLHVRDRGSMQQVVVDAGMTELVRPALYGAWHRICALATGRGLEGELIETRVEGPVCESADTLGVHLLPRLRRGDFVAISTTGAYGSALASHYNGRDLAPELFIESDGKLLLVRDRQGAS